MDSMVTRVPATWIPPAGAIDNRSGRISFSFIKRIVIPTEIEGNFKSALKRRNSQAAQGLVSCGIFDPGANRAGFVAQAPVPQNPGRMKIEYGDFLLLFSHFCWAMGIRASALGIRGSEMSGSVGQARRHCDASARFCRRAWRKRRGSAAVVTCRVMPKSEDLVPWPSYPLLTFRDTFCISCPIRRGRDRSGRLYRRPAPRSEGPLRLRRGSA